MKLKTFILTLTGVSLFLIATGISFAYFSYQKVVVDTKPEIQAATTPQITPTPDPLAAYSVLLMGYGGGTHAGGEITDTMIVANIFPRNKKVYLISIPRDLWVPLPIDESGEPEYHKINSAYAIGNDAYQYQQRPDQYKGESGGARLASDMVKLVTNLEPQFFIVVDFSSFKSVINNLGGITVEVPVSFTDEFYPVEGLEEETCGKSEEEITELSATMSGYKLEQEFTCRYETLNFTAGTQTMDGETALKYVRSRHSETFGNDFSRSIRQQTVIEGLQTKLVSLGSVPKLVPLINLLTDSVRTNITISDLYKVWSTHGELSEFEFESILLSTDNVLKESRSVDRQYILIPDQGMDEWEEIHDYIQQEIESDQNT